MVGDDELLKLRRGVKIGVGDEIDLEIGALGAPDGGEEVVALQGGVDVRGRDVQGVHAVWVQPDAHGQVAGALDADALHAGNGLQLGLHLADEVLVELRERERVAGKAHIERGVGLVGALDVHDGRLGLRRELAADLVEPGADLGQRRVRAVVEPEVDGDYADVGGAGALDVVDPIYGGDGPLDGGGDEAADDVGAGADVGRGDDDRAGFQPGILADGEIADGAPAHGQDDQVDHQGQNGALDEDVREGSHGGRGDSGNEMLAGARAGAIRSYGCLEAVLACALSAAAAGAAGTGGSGGMTVSPSMSLNEPEVATFSPGFRPSSTMT